MNDKDKSKEQLIAELNDWRTGIFVLEERGQHQMTERSYEADHPGLMDKLPGIFLYRHNTEGIFTYVSSSVTEVLGYTPEEFLTHFTEYLTENPCNEEVQKHTALSMEGIQQHPYEVQIFHKDGSIHWLEVSEIPVHDANGNIIAVEGIGLDITDRKQAEEELIRTKDFSENIINTSADGIMVLDDSAGIIRVNRALCKMLGYSADEIIGKRTGELSVRDEEHSEKNAEMIEQLFEKGYVNNWGVEWYRKDGSSCLTEVNISLLRDQEGNHIGSVSAIRDITERKQAENELREREERFRAIAESMPDAMMITDREGKITYWNEAAAKIFGYEDKEVLGKSIELFMPKPVKTGYVKQREQFFETGVSKYREALYESTIMRKDGSEIPVEISRSAWEMNDQNYHSAIIRDITLRKRAEEALIASQLRRSLHVEQTPLAVIEWNLDFEVTEWNPAAEKIFGFTKEEALGRHPIDFIVAESIKGKIDTVWEGLMAKKGGARSTNENITKRGEPIICEWYNTPLVNRDGQVIGVASLAQDITERIHAEQKLLTHQEQLRSLSAELLLAEEKERHRIATLLHDDIGQSLAFSKMKLGRLKQLGMSQEAAEGLNEIHDITDQMVQETRSLTFDLSPPILYELGLEAAIEWLSEQNEQKYGIATEFISERGVEPSDESFRVLLFQATRELLFNTVKHSRAKKVKIYMKQKNSQLRITVEDDGIGFNSKRILPKKDKRTGFGLFSINERLRYIGGGMEIVSKSRKGTQVSLVVPMNDGR